MNDRLPEPDTVVRRVASLVRPEIRALSAYHVAQAGGFIKLDANESPYPMPEAVQAKIAAAVAAVHVNRYPDGAARAVIAALRAWLDLPASFDLLAGNGSDELLQMIALALARPGGVVLAPEPTFVMYRMNALYAGMRFVGVPLNADFSLDIDAMEAAIEREQPALVFLASPNNPTGNSFAESHIQRILHAAPGLVVVDEAYGAFAAANFLPRLAAFPNLLVLRTLSKIGMAALRLGYAIAAPEWIAELNKVRPPYNLNALTQAAATVLLQEGELLAEQAAAVRAERTRLSIALTTLPGMVVYPSQANFVVVRVAHAPDWFARLRAAGILVKNLQGTHPLLAGCLRITIGTPAENDALLAALENDCMNAPMTTETVAASPRTAKVERNTAETRIAVEVNLDGTGHARLATGVPFLDHMLDQIARHGLIDLAVEAKGDLHIDGHHTVEDVGIALGQAVKAALGDKKGLTRYGHAYVPLDEALSRVVIDLSGRPGLEFNVPFTRAMIGAFDVDLTHEFFQGFVNHSLVTLHVDNLRGQNAHHQAETVFKAFARALRMAVSRDARAAGVVPSTKGAL